MNAPMTRPLPAAPPTAKRMTLANISRGRLSHPIRVLLVGVEGIGKSTFAAQAPSPVFIGPERGTSQLDVARFPQAKTYQDVVDALQEMLTTKHEFKSVALDTADWIESLLVVEGCRRAKTRLPTDNFGAGYKEALVLWRALLVMFDDLTNHGMNVILLGHCIVKTFKNPEGDDYDRYILAMNENSAGLLRQWADEVLFANFKTLVDKEKATDRKGKGLGGDKRVMYTQRRPAFDAKSRHGLPAEMPLSWDEFYAAINSGSDQIAALRAEITTALAELEAVAPDIAEKARASVAQAGDDLGKLRVKLTTIRARIAENAPKNDEGAGAEGASQEPGAE